MKRFSVLHGFYKPFYSADFYRDVAQNWKGVGFALLLVVVTTSWLPAIWWLQGVTDDFLTDDAPRMARQVPPMSVVDGRLYVEATQPYVLTLPDSTEPLAVIDTSGQMSSLEDTNAKILVTATQIHMQKSEHEIHTYNLEHVESFQVNPEDILRLINLILDYYLYILIPMLILTSFAYRAFQAVIYGGIGTVFASGMNVNLSFQQCMRLAVASVIPVILLDTLFSLIGVRPPMWFLICFMITMGYLLFGVRANKGVGSTEARAESS